MRISRPKGNTAANAVEGMEFDRGYLSPYMVTDPDKMEAVIDDALILITDKKISNIHTARLSIRHSAS